MKKTTDSAINPEKSKDAKEFQEADLTAEQAKLPGRFVHSRTHYRESRIVSSKLKFGTAQENI
jgi:hypothetical protein